MIRLLPGAEAADEGVGGAVVLELGLCRRLQLGNDVLGKLLAELHTPLVEGVDPPDGALGEDAVLIEGDKGSEGVRIELVGHDDVRRAVPLEYAVRGEPVGSSLSLHLLGSLAEGKRLGLRENIRDEVIVVVPQLVEGLVEADEITRDEAGSLMDELVEGVLAVGAGLAPVDRSRVEGDMGAIEADRLAVALHGELLEVGGEALEVLLVGQYRDALCAEEVVVPDGKETHEHGQVLLKRRGTEMLVHGMEAGEEVGEVLRSDGDHGRETDRRIHRVASADPIPETEHVGGVDAELGDLGGIRGDGHEVLGDGLDVAAEARKRPVARRVRVGHGLEGGEGLGGNNEEGLGGIEVLNGLGKIGAVDIGNEAEGQRTVAVVAEGLVGHDGTEVGASDADVDDVLDALSGVALPLAAANAVGEGSHGPEHLVNLGDNVDTVHLDHLPLGGAECDMEHCAVLGDVDLLPGKHLVTVRLEADFLGKLEQALEGLVVDPVLGVVEVEAARLRSQALTALRIGGEEILERGLGDLVAVGGEGFPGGELGRVGHGKRMRDGGWRMEDEL